jgi:hypothetical protein
MRKERLLVAVLLIVDFMSAPLTVRAEGSH